MKYFLFFVSFLVAFNSFSQTVPLCFSDPTYRSVGSDPQFITSGDFNNDGFPDIAATSRWLNDSITILLNTGDGIIYTRNNYLVGMVPEKIIPADFNNDGNLDLAVATNTTLSGTSISLVYVLIGSPSGTFSAATNYTISGHSNTLITGYFNGDGIIDLAVGGGMNIDYLNGNGDGTFSQSYRMTSQFVVSPFDMIGHDFNSDGKTDIAFIDYMNNNDQLIIYKFGYTLPSLPIPLGTSSCLSLTSGDYNNDGNLDIATCGLDIASVLFGLGGGQFASAVTYTLQGAQEGHGILSLDMNNDSNLDLVICEAQDRIYVLYGSANGAFNVSPSIYSTGTGSMPWAITAADFNVDGKIDFATANPMLSNVSILLNNIAPNVVVSASTNSNALVAEFICKQVAHTPIVGVQETQQP
jgi:hypothetical protein